MLSGKLRHRITIERRVDAQDPNTGAITQTWQTFVADVPAAFLSGPGREFLAADSIRAVVEGRFVIRYYPGITADMRVQWDGRIWNIAASPLLDPTARREITLMVKTGLNDG